MAKETTKEALKRVLGESDKPLGPGDAAEKANKNYNTVRAVLRQMFNQGEADALNDSTYCLPGQFPEVISRVGIQGENASAAGDGVRRKAGAPSASIADEIVSEEDLPEVPRREMPVFGTASAGDGRADLEPPQEAVMVPMSEYHRTFGSKVGTGARLGYWRVDGDSAAPVFFDEELVPVELVEPTQDFSPERVYIFRWNEHFYLKRLVWESRKEICAQSLNPAVSDFRFKPDNGHGFAVLAKVIQGPKQQLYVSLLGEKLLS